MGSTTPPVRALPRKQVEVALEWCILAGPPAMKVLGRTTRSRSTSCGMRACHYSLNRPVGQRHDDLVVPAPHRPAGVPCPGRFSDDGLRRVDDSSTATDRANFFRLGGNALACHNDEPVGPLAGALIGRPGRSLRSKSMGSASGCTGTHRVADKLASAVRLSYLGCDIRVLDCGCGNPGLVWVVAAAPRERCGG